MRAGARKRLDQIFASRVTFDCLLNRYTSFGIGGPADALVVVETRDELASLLAFVEGENLPWRVIGKGSNLLISDDGFCGVIVLLGGEFKKIHAAGREGTQRVFLSVGAGCSITKVNHYCWEEGLGGLEFSYGIPGTIGGAVIMNAGAWGKEIGDVVVEVSLLGLSGIQTLRGSDLDFCYRRWPGYAIYSKNWVITGIVLGVQEDDAEAVKARSKALLQERKQKQPCNMPSAGSFFKNPPGDSAGRLIEACGLKGLSVGGARVSEKHANFLVNSGKATARDVVTLMTEVQEVVRQRFGIELKPEVQLL